jgi:hypothetical protein
VNGLTAEYSREVRLAGPSEADDEGAARSEHEEVERARAVRQVLCVAHDVADAVRLLNMLGLDPGEARLGT